MRPPRTLKTNETQQITFNTKVEVGYATLLFSNIIKYTKEFINNANFVILVFKTRMI